MTAWGLPQGATGSNEESLIFIFGFLKSSPYLPRSLHLLIGREPKICTDVKDGLAFLGQIFLTFAAVIISLSNSKPFFIFSLSFLVI